MKYLIKILVQINQWVSSIIIARFSILFKHKCPKWGSRNNKVECYAGNPYDKKEKWQTGRQCNNCTEFWYK